jgi:hypothetical protein
MVATSGPPQVDLEGSPKGRCRSPPIIPFDCLAGPSLLRSARKPGEAPVARELRKLAADIVGNSRPIERSESGTPRITDQHAEVCVLRLIKPQVVATTASRNLMQRI